MRKSRFEKVKEERRRLKGEGGGPTMFDGIDGLAQHLLGGPMLPTQRRFIYGTERVRGYMGPAGVAKTSSMACSAWLKALLVPGSMNFISRADYNDLMDTTLKTVDRMLQKLPAGTLLDRDKSPPMKWYIKPIDFDNAPIHDVDVSQFTFQGLRDGFGSLEVSSWYVDEADEVDEERAREVTTRFRAPGVHPMHFAAYFVFNPPSKTHWLYTACTGKDHQDIKVAEPWMTLYRPMPNENSHNLPEGYHEIMARSLTTEQKQRLIEGEWGSSFPGSPVFKDFRADIHINRAIVFNPYSTLLRFWDFGYHRPACVFAQLTPFGNLQVLAEILGHEEEVEPFASRVTALTNVKFPHVDVRDYGDPAVKQQKDTGNALAKLHQAGIQILYRYSKIEEGVSLIRKLLSRHVNGAPMIQIHPSCTVLIDALKGGYHLDKDGQTPKKDGFYDHMADAFRYGIVNLFAGKLARENTHDLKENLAYDPNED